jgi:hypothetical protein
MQFQPKADESRRGRVQRARQAVHSSDDAFKGGEESPRRRLGLKSPWLSATSRLWKRPDSGALEE